MRGIILALDYRHLLGVEIEQSSTTGDRGRHVAEIGPDVVAKKKFHRAQNELTSLSAPAPSATLEKVGVLNVYPAINILAVMTGGSSPWSEWLDHSPLSKSMLSLDAPRLLEVDVVG